MIPTERKRQERERQKGAGLVRMEVYVRPEVREKVRGYAERQNHPARAATDKTERMTGMNRLAVPNVEDGQDIHDDA